MNSVSQLVQKFDDLKKLDKMDLSSDQDLTLAIMNLVSIEEHFFFTGAKTGKHEYYDMINEVREVRKGLLKRIIKDYEGEVWCISKHLLAASYRLMEVGTKQLSCGNSDDAYNFFDRAYELYSLFWGLNLGLVDSNGIEKIDDVALNKNDVKKVGLKEKLGGIVKMIVNCCIE